MYWAAASVERPYWRSSNLSIEDDVFLIGRAAFLIEIITQKISGCECWLMIQVHENQWSLIYLPFFPPEKCLWLFSLALREAEGQRKTYSRLQFHVNIPWNELILSSKGQLRASWGWSSYKYLSQDSLKYLCLGYIRVIHKTKSFHQMPSSVNRTVRTGQWNGCGEGVLGVARDFCLVAGVHSLSFLGGVWSLGLHTRLELLEVAYDH